MLIRSLIIFISVKMPTVGPEVNGRGMIHNNEILFLPNKIKNFVIWDLNSAYHSVIFGNWKSHPPLEETPLCSGKFRLKNQTSQWAKTYCSTFQNKRLIFKFKKPDTFKKLLNFKEIPQNCPFFKHLY
jgi:hypothetical protein